MSDWPLQAARSWKFSLACTRIEAEALAMLDDPLPGIDPPPVLMTSEPDETRPDQWRLDVYFEGEPPSAIVAQVRALVPSASRIDPAVEPIADEDWVTASQRGMEPVRAGRFHVHTPAHRGGAPSGPFTFEIDAGRAFGTGHHETTSGCLEALDRVAASRGFANVADIGTGTGLLAFAAHRLWPEARVIASDIDPVSVDVAAVNAAVNGVPVGDAAGEVALVVAAGLEAAALRGRAPYDLVIANILAAPLIALANDFAGALAPRGMVVLAGLLDRQAADVADAYRWHGFEELFRAQRGDWPTLVLARG